ncbi:hypothetical protein HD806DRAFT_428542 [Xylariaceae sp. AK1471]|nr:hypothetical protein HD806DRAFT_428542 [Xylariaceae sp. AK1471]
MADTIRGYGLSRVEAALAALAGDPEGLDRARTRFSDPPPSYISHLSHNSTRSQSPNAPNEEQRYREEQEWKLKIDRAASFPSAQLSVQVHEEERIIEAAANRTRPVPVGTIYNDLAYKNVRKSWVEQGIWNNKWNEMAQGLWKHEEPLEPSSPFETDEETATKSNLFSSLLNNVASKPRRPKNDDEAQRTAEQRIVRHRECEASRPFYQFIYQISKERDRIQEEMRYGHAATSVPADISTRAYENIRSTWIRRGIWDKGWGTLPGMSWKHERPLEEVLDGDQNPQAGPPQNNCPMERVTSVFERHPVAESNPEASDTNVQQGVLTSIDAAGPEGSVEQLGSTPHLLQPIGRERNVCFVGRRSPRRGETNDPSEDEQTQSLARTLFAPVHQPQVAKGPRTKRPGREQHAAKKLSDCSSSSLGAELREPETDARSVPQRKSQRL